MASRSSRHKAQKKRKKSVAPIIGVAALLVVLVVVGIVWLLGRGEEPANAGATDEPVAFTFPDGISVGDIDIAGLTFEEAEDKLASTAEDMMDKSIELTVEGKEEPYQITLDSIGVDVNTQDALNQAMVYVEDWMNVLETEQPEQKNSSKDEETDAPYIDARDFPLELTYDISDIQTRLDELSEAEKWGKSPSTGSYKVDYNSDEASLTTSGRLVQAEPEDGYSVKTAELAELIEQQLLSGEFNSIAAPTEVLEAESAADREVYLLGTATTSFKDSDKNRRYNIWKISARLNGVTFKPGEVFSVNGFVGDRTAANGWKEGMGIEDGMLTPQYGGGICQVSTTMYNASLKAEMKMVNRLPHTMHVKYVPEGLDATISTGGPDFKVQNMLDSEMYMIVRCDNPSSTVTVEIYGYAQRDYDIKLSTERISTTEEEQMKPVEYKVNNELSKYAIKQMKSGQKYSKWQIKGTKIEKGTGKVLEELDLGTSTYQALAPVYEIGPGVPVPETGTSIDKVRASVPGGGSVTTPTLAPDDTVATPSEDTPASQGNPTAQPSSSGSGAATQQPATQAPATQAPATQAPATSPPAVATDPPVAPLPDGGDVIQVE